MSSAERPSNVGICAMEMYIPSRFIPQEELETQDNCAGKYVIGLGQKQMAFVDDREDISSIFLSACSLLLEKYEIDPNDVGRIECGTETLIDKSKSVKTSLMRLFPNNTDMEGVTSTNACYGGTAAIFNSCAWIESSEWDGRYALCVLGDIAVYEKGPARPTGGCGALAILIGPNACLPLEIGLRSSHVIDCYDFYKPHHSEYAAVDGKLSQWAYLSSVDTCYTRYKEKYYKKNSTCPKIGLPHFDYFGFHTPYNKLTQKGFGRMIFQDLRDGFSSTPEENAILKDFLEEDLSKTYESRELEGALKPMIAPLFNEKVMPSCKINQNVGNCYTASVYSSLLSLVNDQGSALEGKRILLFSYGSGSVATLFSVLGRTPSEGKYNFTIEQIKEKSNMFSRLESRSQCSIEEFNAALDLREAKYGQAPMTPDGSVDNVPSGAYYLVNINDKHHRTYEKKA